jgi:hypothetical protein
MQMCLGMLINLLFCFFAEYMAHMIYLLCVSIYIYIKITWACISYVCVSPLYGCGIVMINY